MRLSIGSNAFKGCDSLDYLNLRECENLTISDYAFAGSSLIGVHLPTKIVSIGKNIFDGNKICTSIEYDGTIQEWHSINKKAGLLTGYWNANSVIEYVICKNHEIVYL